MAQQTEEGNSLKGVYLAKSKDEQSRHQMKKSIDSAIYRKPRSHAFFPRSSDAEINRLDNEMGF